MDSARNEMTRRVAFVAEDDDLNQAYCSMVVMDIHHLPVLREGKVVGILSDRDILLHARKKNGRVEVTNKKVRDVMSLKVVSCLPGTSIATVADLMLEHRIHGLPVVNPDGSLVGMITSTDLIGLLRNPG